MTKKESVNRNIGLAFDLLKEINNKPELLNDIPKASAIEFIEKDFPKKERGAKNKRNRKYIRVKNEFEFN
ncbi:MAG: hypothetical protein K2X48_19065 [Chitinophagaceae bacterium]|nr:hypothetical protein [Chitinophagaceae bacterium]